MKRRTGFTSDRAACLGIAVCCGFAIVAANAGRAGERGGQPSSRTHDVVEAVNALVPSDVAIPAAQSAACGLERLPNSRAAILPLVPSEHRRLIEECGRGRLRLQRRQVNLDVSAMIDEAADRPECVAVVRAYFAGRPVDVAIGAGLSDGPYPISFDWAIVLDPRSQTLFSFVLNCRD